MVKHLRIKASLQSYIIICTIIISDRNICAANLVKSIIISTSLTIRAFLLINSLWGIVKVIIHFLDVFIMLAITVLRIVYLKEVYVSLCLLVSYYHNCNVGWCQCSTICLYCDLRRSVLTLLWFTVCLLRAILRRGIQLGSILCCTNCICCIIASTWCISVCIYLSLSWRLRILALIITWNAYILWNIQVLIVC